MNPVFTLAIETCNRHTPLFHPKVTLWDEFFYKLKQWKEIEQLYLIQTPDDRFDATDKDFLKEAIHTMNIYLVNKHKVAPVFENIENNKDVYNKIQLYFQPRDHTVMLLLRHALDLVSKVIAEFTKHFFFLETQVKTKQATSEQRLAYYEINDNYFEWIVLILQFFISILFDFMMDSHIDKFNDTFELFKVIYDGKCMNKDF